MTRFARSKGSKASNERTPENATPWKVMKEELQRKKQEAEDNKEREKMNKARQENYTKFLKEQANDVKTEWAEFPEAATPKKQKLKTQIQKKDKQKNVAEEMISKKEILEMLKPDPVIDAKLEELKSEINKVLDKDSNENNNSTEPDKVSKSKKVTENNSVGNENKGIENERNINGDVLDDTPMEVSSKIIPKNIVVGKKKQKKTLLKISTTNEVEKDAEDDKKNDGDNPTELTKSMRKRLKRKKQIETKKKYKNAENENGVAPPEMTKSKQKRLKRKQKEAKNNDNEEKNSSMIKPQGNLKRKISDENYEKPSKFPRKEQKTAKVRDNKKREEHPRRKPEEGPIKMMFNGIEIEVVKYDGFPIKKEDAERLTELRKQMISKGIPRSEVQRTMKLERRKAEKSLAREKKKVCFNCRKAGHMLSECPELNSEQVDVSGSGICFKCGSTEHTHFECKVQRGEEYKFAKCFICREQGHIAKQCPDNPKGLYPQGGACKLCGDVTHLKKDCPQNQQEKDDNTLFLKTISGNIESIDDDLNTTVTNKSSIKNKVVRF